MFDHHETLTAVAVYGRLLQDRHAVHPHQEAGLALLMKDLPVWKDLAIDVYYAYWGTAALWEADGPDGPRWDVWNRAVKQALLPSQNGSGEKRGSWNPVSRWSLEGGRVFVTAINALTLETYYRHQRVLR